MRMDERTKPSDAASTATRVRQDVKRAAIVVGTVVVVLLILRTSLSSSRDYRPLFRGIVVAVVVGIGLWRTMPTAAEKERYDRWKGLRR